MGVRGLALIAAVLAVGASAVRAEPLLVSLEGTGAAPLTAPQSDRFGLGGSVAGGVAYPVAPAFLVGARLRAGLLSDGDAPLDPSLRDPGTGTFETLSLAMRLRPFARETDGRLGTGLFIDAGGGGVITGELLRAGLEAGMGWGLPAGDVAIAPVIRYMQVVQPSDPLSDEDARLFLFGVEVTFNDERPPIERAAAPPKVVGDRDGDGFDDEHDMCPDEPEDVDDFQDGDGCPEPDNDHDGLADAADACPNDAEDGDGFEDQDGCPDFDNDMDGFPDIRDDCPDEAEVVNGVNDHDGCPDEGLIELKANRVVLEERVLFDFERARVHSAAKPVLRAIVELYTQHPEWTKLRVEGHTDTRGDETFNQRLSERRANNVRRELVKMGIPEGVIESVGFGSQRLRDPGTTEAAHERNRRVEFVVVTDEAGQAPAAPQAPAAADPSQEAP